MSQRSILFGGTFDPIHTAHLILAEGAAEELGVDSVLFVPSAHPPHKDARHLTTVEHRVKMVRLAIEGNRRFHLCTVELERPGQSYAIDTIRQIASQLPAAERPILLLGCDSLLDLHLWKEPEKLLREAEVVVAPRSGFDRSRVDAAYWEHLRTLETPRIALSATAIRARVKRGESIRYLVPEPVRQYIVTEGLYRHSGGG